MTKTPCSGEFLLDSGDNDPYSVLLRTDHYCMYQPDQKTWKSMRKNRLKALIVDPDEKTRTQISELLKKNQKISEILEATSAEEALYEILDQSPDIVFLNILLHGRSGSDLISLLERKKMFCNIVMMSNKKEAVIQAIKNNVYDFLLKPVKVTALRQVIDKISKKAKAGMFEKFQDALHDLDNKQRIKISSTASHTLIDPSDILYCEAQGSYTTLYLNNGRKELANNYLGLIEKKLADLSFFRISRYFLINLDKLSEINKGDNTCILTNGEQKIKLHGSKKQLRLLYQKDLA